jgi:hypothetical protein
LDTQDIRAIGRRAALFALIGGVSLTTSGCQAVYAILARLHGDDSFDEGAAEGSEDYEDPHLNRNDRDRESRSDSAATKTDDPSDGLPPDDGTIPE